MLSSEEVRQRVPGLTYRMLYHWTQNGYIQPVGGLKAVMFNAGPGHQFRYPTTSIPILERMVALTKAGFSPKSASALAHAPDGTLQIDNYTLTLTGPR